MKLQKKVKGRDLGKIIIDSLNAEGYKTEVQPKLNGHDSLALGFLRRYYEGCPMVFDPDTVAEYSIVAHKYKTEDTHTELEGKWKGLYWIPIVGWAMYLKDKCCHSKHTDTKLKMEIDSSKEYNEFSFAISRKSHYDGLYQDIKEQIDKTTLEIHPNLKAELRNIESYIHGHIEE